MNPNCNIFIILFYFFFFYTNLNSKIFEFDLYSSNEIIDASHIILDSNELLILDNIQNKIFSININNNITKQLDVEKRIKNYFNKNSISQSRIYSLKIINNVPYCAYIFNYTENDILTYNFLLVNLENFEIKIISNNKNYIVYGKEFDYLCDSTYIFQTYTSNYHHSKHSALKDSVSFISLFSDNNLHKIYSIGDLEKYSTINLAYAFDLSINTFKNNFILMMKDLDLLTITKYNCVDNSYEMKNLERNEFLNQYFIKNKVNEPFKAYDKYIFTNKEKLKFLNIFVELNDFFLLFYTNNGNKYYFNKVQYNSENIIENQSEFELISKLENPFRIIKIENNLNDNLIGILDQNYKLEIHSDKIK